MLISLATFLHTHRRRVLYLAVLAAAVAAVFGAGVAKHLSPYGQNDPATQSVQAKNRYESATGRQIDPGIVALVSIGDVHSTAAAQRVGQVANQLRAQPDMASVVTYYQTHNPAAVSRDGRSTYVVAYFKPLSDSRLKDDAQLIENRFAEVRDVKLDRGHRPGSGTTVCCRSTSESPCSPSWRRSSSDGQQFASRAP